MKKKLSIVLGLMLLAGMSVSAEGIKYVLNGKASKDLDGSMAYLAITTKRGRTANDSTKIVNGAFTFKGELGGCDIARVYTMKAKREVTFYALTSLENGTVSIDCTNPNNIVLKGGKMSSAINEYVAAMDKYDKKEEEMKIKDMVAEFRKPETSKERKQEIVKLYNELSSQREAATVAILEKNYTNIFGAYLLQDLSSVMSEEQVEEKFNKGNEEFRAYAPIKSTMARINAAKVRRAGNTYLDFEQPDVDGKAHKLSEYMKTSKYILVDFWASWCAPCRAEIPNVKKAYEKYHAKGFEVIGVSLDNKKAAWTDAIAKFALPWPQLSDLQGWKCSASSMYGVNGIPCTMLIDCSTGKIIGGDYRGEQLEKKLDELFK